jgi:hypothetical protein
MRAAGERPNPDNPVIRLRDVPMQEVGALPNPDNGEQRLVEFAARIRLAEVRQRLAARRLARLAENVGALQQLRGAQRRLDGLEHIARDTQSVHTTVVSQQTNLYTKKLLEKGGDDKECYPSPERFISQWLDGGFLTLRNLPALSADLDRFYSLHSVREPNDYLYRRVFNAVGKVIADIADKERRLELSKRLFEECTEAVGMCAEGHMARLCNVFIGFFDEFVPFPQVRELLQQKIGAISLMDVSTEEKLRLATGVFGELKVSEADQVPWREALGA